MTKHFIEYLLTAALAVMTAQSCVSKIDPIFDESSANRVVALAVRLNVTLSGGPYGWLLVLLGWWGVLLGGVCGWGGGVV